VNGYLIAFTIGCGPGGPPRYDISGSITYNGKPVPGGRIVFEPDREQNNHGPASYAVIKDGHYATDSGKGPVGGPHIVRIMGRDGVSTFESPHGTTIFPEYRTKVDLPREDTGKDFEVPK